MSQSFDQYWNTHALFGVQVCQNIYQMQLELSKTVYQDQYNYTGLHYDDILVLVSLQSLKKRRDDISRGGSVINLEDVEEDSPVVQSELLT